MEKKELHTTAELAMLELTQAEAERFGNAVSQILEYFDTMAAVDVENLEPTTHALAKENRLREDKPDIVEETLLDQHSRCFDLKDALLEQAPEVVDRFIIIPKVL